MAREEDGDGRIVHEVEYDGYSGRRWWHMLDDERWRAVPEQAGAGAGGAATWTTPGIGYFFLHFCSLLREQASPLNPKYSPFLQWCSLCRGCSLCWGGMRGVFGAMPSASTRYRGAASSPARA